MPSKKVYYEGRGSRKRSVARVRIYEGSDISVINDKPYTEYFSGEKAMNTMMKPLVACGLADKMYFTAKVKGGGITGQIEAIQHGISKALVEMDENLRKDLRPDRLLSRDPREVERKKYFFRKARKKPQFSKR